VPAWRPELPSARSPPARARDAWAACPALLVYRAVKLAGAPLFTCLELRGRSRPRRLFLLCCCVVSAGAECPAKRLASQGRSAPGAHSTCARSCLRAAAAPASSSSALLAARRRRTCRARAAGVGEGPPLHADDFTMFCAEQMIDEGCAPQVRRSCRALAPMHPCAGMLRVLGGHGRQMGRRGCAG